MTGLLSLPLMLGCVRSGSDCTVGGLVRIGLDWGDREPPRTTLFYFYGGAAGEPIIRKGTSGGYEGTLPAGVYNVVMTHGGISGAGYEVNGTFEGDQLVATSLTRAIGSLSDVYGASITGVEARSGRVAEHRVAPRNYTRRITFTIPTDDNIRSAEVEIDGIVRRVRAFDGKPFDGDATSVRTPMQSSTEGFRATVAVFGFVAPATVRAWVDFSGHGIHESLPVDISDEVSALGDDGGDIALELIFPTGPLEMNVEFHPWQSGSSGSGTVQ